MKRKLTLIFLLFCLAAGQTFAQRVKYTINESWRFAKTDSNRASEPGFDDSAWSVLSLPHTWNNLDAMDETAGYYRGKGWYRKTVTIDATARNKQVYLHFEGANQVTNLWINGQHVGEHKGGYTAFIFDITPYLKEGENLFAVEVDNSHNPLVPPLSGDFTFFGGIYRDVSLIYTAKTHLTTTDYASSGVYLTTPEVSRDKAVVEIRTLLTNASGQQTALTVEHTLTAPDGKFASTVTEKIRKAATGNSTLNSRIEIPQPMLWDIQNPQLYTVITKIKNDRGEVVDAVTNPLGLRWFSFDPDKGFFLNGEYVKLIGTNRHQDYYRRGNALPDEMHVRDVKLLKEMGGNFLRIAHYPQDPVMLQMCDKLGIVVSVEIPVVNAITMDPAFQENSLHMLREMIYQGFNSPSVVMWAYMNEVMLRPPYDPADETAKRAYMDYVYKITESLDRECRRIDPARYTMMACHGNPNLYDEAGITAIPMILGWNLYNGWYGNGFTGFEKTLDDLHGRYPNQSLLVTEYGADVDPRIHSFDSERFDFSCEYGVKFHEHYIRQILDRDFMAGSTVWNLNDFYSEDRKNAVPYTNNKGITGLDRERKDTYFLYKALLTDEPVMHIENTTWKFRAGTADASGNCTQSVKLFTNVPEAELMLNGRSLGRQPVKDNNTVFSVPFRPGENRLEAVGVKDGKTIREIAVVQFDMIPQNLRENGLPVHGLNILLGSKRYFEDRPSEFCWIPEQPYTPGSWGYTGGEAVRAKTRHGSLPAQDIDVLGTDQDPIFQTQRKGLESFRADVPDGNYSVYLYWCEFSSTKEREALAYNLGNDVIAEQTGERIFDVSINGTPQIDGLNLAGQFGEHRSVIKKFDVIVENGQGITVGFTPVSGEPVLNAVRIIKNF